MENRKQKIELADILRDHESELLEKYGSKLCSNQLKAIKAIVECRTNILGGYINKCDHCTYQTQAYRSCRNRHCPKCQYTKQQQWVDRIKSSLPDMHYYHLVFTIPDSLHHLFYQNQTKCYGFLFRAAWSTLQKVALMPHILGAETGAIAILHTNGQTLQYHPHIHMIVPAGGLSVDGMELLQSPDNFFLPAKLLCKVYRNALCDLLEKSWNDQLKLPDKWECSDFKMVREEICKKKWNVNIQKAFGGVEHVVNYLGNYIHRVAISNHRIVGYDGTYVTFKYKDHKTGIANRTMKLTALEFIKRFLLHILPSGFCKIRYYGIFASVQVKTKRDLVFDLLDKDHYYPKLVGLTGYEVYRFISGKDPCICPKCKKGKLRMQPIPEKSG